MNQGRNKNTDEVRSPKIKTTVHLEFAAVFPSTYTVTCGALPAVVRSVRLDAAALGTLVDHLSRLELQALDEFFRSVPFGHGSLREE